MGCGSSTTAAPPLQESTHANHAAEAMKAQDRADAFEYEENEATKAANIAQGVEDAAKSEIDSCQMAGQW